MTVQNDRSSEDHAGKCGAALTRCTACDKSVGAARVRKGLGCGNKSCPGDGELLPGKCREGAGERTDHPGFGPCWRHGGRTWQHEAHAIVVRAELDCARFGVEVDTTAGEALARLVRKQQGVVDLLEQAVSELPRFHPEDDEYHPPQGSGDDQIDEYWIRGEMGVYGRTYHVSGVPTGEAKPHILYVMWREAKKDLAEYTVAASRAGVEERLLQIQESVQDEFSQRFLKAMLVGVQAAGLSDEQIGVLRSAIADYLRQEPQPLSR